MNGFMKDFMKCKHDVYIKREREREKSEKYL